MQLTAYEIEVIRTLLLSRAAALADLAQDPGSPLASTWHKRAAEYLALSDRFREILPGAAARDGWSVTLTETRTDA
ncbi:hypothetical protein ABZ801_41425 [Actinomadura sp. NPDC047616]|uniref:hypothetical protein n=1 Tax=Actinomadura sp. NPDC047616 TaxID=3155914 RepID=UPI0033E58BB1